LPSEALPIDLNFSSYDIPRVGERLSIIGELGKTKLDPAASMQIVETLINEEALLFAKYLRAERKNWIPRRPIACMHE
jgi:hypothetical protein